MIGIARSDINDRRMAKDKLSVKEYEDPFAR